MTSLGLFCPRCNRSDTDSEILETRRHAMGKKRRRRCAKCGAVWNTLELRWDHLPSGLIEPRHSHSATTTDRAKTLREMGVQLEIIAYALNIPVSEVRRETDGIQPNWVWTRRSFDYRAKPMPKGQMALPNDKALRGRIVNLKRRGYDLPPSKAEEYRVLRTKGFSAVEAKDLLKLE